MAWVLNDPPHNYGEELAECQRRYIDITDHAYAYGFCYSSTRAAVFLPLPVTLASNPTIVVKKVGSIRAEGLSTAPTQILPTPAAILSNGIVMEIVGNGFPVNKIAILADFSVAISCDL